MKVVALCPELTPTIVARSGTGAVQYIWKCMVEMYALARTVCRQSTSTCIEAKANMASFPLMIVVTTEIPYQSFSELLRTVSCWRCGGSP